ncbi:MAG: DsrE family protein [Gammaproteobacteria bacterium]|nr:DsrE family protein [Gammaproteobacteria bacterium]
MIFKLLSSLSITILMFYAVIVQANEVAPWGVADRSEIKYEPQKVLYDLTTADKKSLQNILDRIGLLYKLYESDPLGSSIIIVVHGNAIPYFAIANAMNLELMKRAHSFTVGAPIEFRMCQAAAKVLGYEPKDIHGFVKMVPMADAEIIKLQKDGYAYMQ